ncbi:thiosulfate sulfurtransferase 18-like [Lycium ferocissimum]|uniref:thiosulfate sulfurtransferase 18-like n=1 Tax=Lycium ferocissimum TaxID=112874 RepID=UPI002815D9EB|nr:thiosulfate sulfurtransferase 18-like [Lycium ferocissimum]
MGNVLCNSFLSLLLFVLLLFCSSGAEVVTIDVHATRHLLRSGHRYLDVRTEEEFKKGHVENSLNIPYMLNTPQGRVKNTKFTEQVSSACDKEDKLIVGCQSGVRSLYATTDLLTAEFKHVSNMGGGYVAWVDNGFAVNKPQDEL